MCNVMCTQEGRDAVMSNRRQASAAGRKIPQIVIPHESALHASLRKEIYLERVRVAYCVV